MGIAYRDGISFSFLITDRLMAMRTENELRIFAACLRLKEQGFVPVEQTLRVYRHPVSGDAKRINSIGATRNAPIAFYRNAEIIQSQPESKTIYPRSVFHLARIK